MDTAALGGELPEHVLDVLRDLEAEVGREIVFRSGYIGRPAEPDENLVQVHIYGVPGEFTTNDLAILVNAETGSTPRIYDCLVPTQTPALDHQIRAPYTYDELIGEVTAGVVYSYIGLHREWFGLADEKFLEAVLYEPIRRSVDPIFLEQYEAEQALAQREGLERWARSLYDRQIEEKRLQIDVAQTTITNLADRLASSYRQLREEQQMLDALLAVQSHDGAETLVREWELLTQHPRVSATSFHDGALVVTTTDDLRIHHPNTGTSRWLGRFRITIDPATSTVKLVNLDTARGGRDHPHVVNNRPCFGGHEYEFAELLSKGEVYTLFELLLGYLEAFNPDDEYGRYGAYWFEADDVRPEVYA